MLVVGQAGVGKTAVTAWLAGLPGWNRCLPLNQSIHTVSYLVLEAVVAVNLSCSFVCGFSFKIFVLVKFYLGYFYEVD